MKKVIKKWLSKLYFLGKTYYDQNIYSTISSIGKNSTIGPDCDIQNGSNIVIGKNCSIGKKATLWAVNAKIIIDDYVIFGPNVTCITGNHDIHVLGKRMAEITENDKRKDMNLDQDIIIEEDCWIGANVTILKGVAIKEGCVIAAGAVVTKSCETPYGIYAGVPAKLIKMRFTEDEIKKHKEIINNADHK